MKKRDFNLLQKVFEREIVGSMLQSKSQEYVRLAGMGYVFLNEKTLRYDDGLPPMKIIGWNLTPLGHMEYCQNCYKGGKMKTHELKIDPKSFQAVWDGFKTCELRFNDRDFKVEDIVWLRETAHSAEEMKLGAPLQYTGREDKHMITHILKGPILGLMDGWVILSFE